MSKKAKMFPRLKIKSVDRDKKVTSFHQKCRQPNVDQLRIISEK